MGNFREALGIFIGGLFLLGAELVHQYVSDNPNNIPSELSKVNRKNYELEELTQKRDQPDFYFIKPKEYEGMRDSLKANIKSLETEIAEIKNTQVYKEAKVQYDCDKSREALLALSPYVLLFGGLIIGTSIFLSGKDD